MLRKWKIWRKMRKIKLSISANKTRRMNVAIRSQGPPDFDPLHNDVLQFN